MVGQVFVKPKTISKKIKNLTTDILVFLSNLVNCIKLMITTVWKYTTGKKQLVHKGVPVYSTVC